MRSRIDRSAKSGAELTAGVTSSTASEPRPVCAARIPVPRIRRHVEAPRSCGMSPVRIATSGIFSATRKSTHAIARCLVAVPGIVQRHGPAGKRDAREQDLLPDHAPARCPCVRDRASGRTATPPAPFPSSDRDRGCAIATTSLPGDLTVAQRPRVEHDRGRRARRSGNCGRAECRRRGSRGSASIRDTRDTPRPCASPSRPHPRCGSPRRPPRRRWSARDRPRRR